RFDLERRDIDAADLEHVVGPAAVGVVAVAIDDVFLTAARPRAQKRGEASRAIVPEIGRAVRSAYLQLADLAGRGVLAGLVDDAQLVSGHRLAGGAVAHVATAIRQ